MRKTFLLLGLFVASLFGKAARQDTARNGKLSQTDIEVLFNYYNQDGNHSAVTGGRGTEKLSVYSPQLYINSLIRNKHRIQFTGGADIITSASTDKIDFVKSSASYRDQRAHAQVGYTHLFKTLDLQTGVSAGFSLESDYMAIPFSISTSVSEPNRMRSYQFRLAVSVDDLRWGRFSPDHRKPVKLIYPAELRYREWDSQYLRQSYHLQTSVSQVLNKRMTLSVFPEGVFQQGLLSTPFHRVYFRNGSVRVEHLPSYRWKAILGAHLNWYATNRLLFRMLVSYSADNWGIHAGSAQIETPVKILRLLTLSPFARVHYQSSAHYFRPYGMHEITSSYYTSDFDLSHVTTITGGTAIRYAPAIYAGRNFLFSEVVLRYAAYYRSDGLIAHLLTTTVTFRSNK